MSAIDVLRREHGMDDLLVVDIGMLQVHLFMEALELAIRQQL